MLTVTLAVVPFHVGIPNVMAPDTIASFPPGMLAVALFSNVPVPIFPALSPFTVTFISYSVCGVNPVNKYVFSAISVAFATYAISASLLCLM